MDGLPVVIRLIDPPLHEFLPSHEELIADVTRLRTTLELAGDGSLGVDAGLVQQGLVKLFGTKDAARAMRKIGLSKPEPGLSVQAFDRAALERELAEKEELLQAVEAMREQNPMLGLRGVRLGLMVPDIVKMQGRAILAGAARVAAEGKTPLPEIMIPLVGHVNELRETRAILEAEVARIVETSGQQVDYKFGTMIEVPRGALTADEIAEHAEFFSFGTNDLTQMAFGYSRDDAEGKFLMQYVDRKILPENPFQVLDVAGIGQLVRIARREGSGHQAGSEDRHLRRARWRPAEHRLLPRGRPELRELLAVPGSGGAAGGGAGRARHDGDARQVTPSRRPRCRSGRTPGRAHR